MSTGRKITQFKTIKDADLAKDATLWVAGDSSGTLYKPTIKQFKTLVTSVIKAWVDAWWITIKASAQTISGVWTITGNWIVSGAWAVSGAWTATGNWIVTGKWKFNVIRFNTFTNNNKQEGDIWYDGDKVSIEKAVTEDVITSHANPYLVGQGERMLSANDGGGVMANFGILEEIVTDIDIVDKCMLANYLLDNIYTSTITPANNKIFYKGQICRSTSKDEPYMYKAISNNTVMRIPLG